jgi:hypothetical protein
MSFPKTNEEVHAICKRYNIKKYYINPDFSINVIDRVRLYSKSLMYIPLKFNIVYGDFCINDNDLRSFEGCPEEVHGNFFADDNKIRTMEYFPKVITGLTSIDII